MKMTEKHKQKIRDSIAARYPHGRPNATGTKHSDETRAKISRALKGRKRTESQKREQSQRMKEWWANRSSVELHTTPAVILEIQERIDLLETQPKGSGLQIS